MLKKSKSGGFRPGSGRPKGTGKYREATEPLRVPRSLLPQVKDLLAYYLEQREGALIDGIDGIDEIVKKQATSAYRSEPIRTESIPAHRSVVSANRTTFGKSASVISSQSAQSEKSSPHFNSAFPLYATRVAAGFPSPADDHIEAKLDLNQHLVKHPASTFFVRVEGESMIGAGIYPNDILVVDRSLKPSSGKVIIAVVNSELTVKRLKIGKGTLTLLAENPEYPSIPITEEMSFSIWGVVTNVIHAL